MKTATDFKPDAAMALLLMGAPGSGKTNLAMEFPNPYFIDWGDANLRSAVERHPGKPFHWDKVEVDEQDREVPFEKRFERGSALLKANAGKPEVGTIVDDSLSMMQEAIQAFIVLKGSQAESPLVIGGEKVMTRSMWSAFKMLLTKRIIAARSVGKPYILTCHEKVDADDMSGVKIYRPNLSGQMGDTIASLFTDFWSAEAVPHTDLKRYPTGVRYYVRTAPTARIKLKCSCGLPPEMEFSWEAFMAHQASHGGAK
jgi:hypothetical protein